MLNDFDEVMKQQELLAQQDAMLQKGERMI